MEDKGFPQMNAFLVHRGVMNIMKQLSKGELMCLLYLFGGEEEKAQKMKEEVETLKQMGILNNQNNFVWSKSGERVTFVKQRDKVKTKFINEKIQTIDELIESQPKSLQKAIALYLGGLRQANIPITIGHVQSWVNKITPMTSNKHFETAIKKAIDKKNCYPATIQTILNEITAELEEKDSGW